MASYGLRHLQEEENPTKRVTRANAKLLDVADVPAKQPVRRGLAERKNAAAPESRKPTFEPKQVEPEKPHRRSRGKETFEGKENANELQGIVGQHDEDGLDRVIGCADYINDIYAYLLSVEDDFAVDEGFLVDKEVTPKMRSILVDWLMQVHLRFHLLPETLHLTIYLVDRFLTEAKVSKAELQLVGVTCMFIASKYEEMYAPEIVDFEFITDNTYSKKDIIKMEVLSLLNHEVSDSCPWHNWIQIEQVALAAFRAMAHSELECEGGSAFTSEIGLLDYSLAHIRPSVMACVSLWLACRIHGLPHSRASIAAHFSVVTSPSLWEDEIRLFARAVVKLHTQSKLMALRSKFAASKWHNASNLKPECIELLTKIYTSTGTLD